MTGYRVRAVTRLVAVLVALSGAAGIALAKKPSPKASNAVRAPSEDERLFATRCGICHSEMGPGTLVLAARLGKERALLTQRHDLDAGRIAYVVRNGLGGMPPQTRVDVSDAELLRIEACLTGAARKPGEAPRAHGDAE